MLNTKTPLERAKERCGGPSGLADKLNTMNPAMRITPQAISQWRQVPAVRAVDVERASGIPRHELRPDVFREPDRAAS